MAITGSAPHLDDESPKRSATALDPIIALLPLAAHRLAEHVAVSWCKADWSEVALHVAPPVAMGVAALVLWRHSPPLPGTRPRGVPGERALGIAAGLLLGTLAAVVNLLTMLAGSGGAGVVSQNMTLTAVALVVHVALLAPVAEEVAFRGLVYRHLRHLMIPGAAMLLSSGLFAVMHSSLQQGIWAFLLGMVAAFAYEQTKSVVTPVLVHGLFNAVPIGVAVVRSQPHDVGPVWLVLAIVAIIFTCAARSANKARRTRG